MYVSSDGFTNRLMMVLTTYFLTADLRRSMATPPGHPQHTAAQGGPHQLTPVALGTHYLLAVVTAAASECKLLQCASLAKLAPVRATVPRNVAPLAQTSVTHERCHPCPCVADATSTLSTTTHGSSSPFRARPPSRDTRSLGAAARRHGRNKFQNLLRGETRRCHLIRHSCHCVRARSKQDSGCMAAMGTASK